MHVQTSTEACEAPGAPAHPASQEALVPPLQAPHTESSDASPLTADDEVAIHRFAQQRHLPQRSIGAWLGLGADAARMVLELSAALRLRTGQLAVLLEILPEIALREGVNAAAVLARPEIKRLATAPGAAPARAHELLNALRALRYPRLSRMLTILQSHIEALHMPPTVTIALPRELNSGQLVIELRAGSTGELDQALSALHQRRGQLAHILELLDGIDEL
jgi:hypothetical protein